MDFIEGTDEAATTPRSIPRGAEFYHVVAAMLPMPVMAFAADGALLVSNEAAERLLVSMPDGNRRRPMTFDGMDLWELLSGALERGRSQSSVHARMRLASGRSAEFDFWVLASWQPRDTLVGAVVLAGEFPDELDADVVTGTGRPTERGEVESCMHMLRSALKCDAVYLLELEAERSTRARLLYCDCDGDTRSGEDWLLTGTPAGAVTGRRVLCYPHGLQERYPDDEWIAREGFESYAGTSIHGPSGDRIGILGAVWRKPLADPQTARAVIGLVGARLARDIWHERSRRELTESEERYSALFRHTHLPMVVIDPDSSQIVEANDAACEFYGYPCEELTTMSIFQIDTLEPEHVKKELHRAIEGTRDYFQFKHRVASGTVREVELYAGPINMHSRDMIYAIVHDVSERRRAEEELEHYRQNLERLVEQRTNDLLRANAELQQVTQARDVFFANMSHELRTPLYTIIGLSDMLLGGLVGDMEEEQSKQVGMVNEAGRSLLDLISDVLDISGVETGTAVCEAEEFDVVELAESTLFSMRGPAEDKGLEVHFATSQRPIMVNNDRFKLQQILMNLISNAIKYTSEGAIYVSVSAPKEGRTSVSVIDSGIGIPEEELPYVFQEFRQMSRGDSGTHEGTGLGLALSRKLADVLGAEIVVTSERGKGATFTIILPDECPSDFR